MKKQSSSIKKGIICCLSLFCSLSIQAQKLGDYIEIDSVPAFIFYIDNTGKHGLAMSMPAVYSDMLKKIDKYVKKGLIDKRQAELSKKGNVIDIKNYEESGMLKPKNKQKLFENLIPKLTEKGEENAAIIEAYCKEQNILMQEHFPWEYWASQLGQGWFIPGDYELTLFAQFYSGGIGKDYHMGISFLTKRGKELSNNTRVQDALTSITSKGGLISSTAKYADCGFRTLHRFQKTMPKLTYWFELLDNLNGAYKELNVQTCAIHKF